MQDVIWKLRPSDSEIIPFNLPLSYWTGVQFLAKVSKIILATHVFSFPLIVKAQCYGKKLRNIFIISFSFEAAV